MTLVVGTFNLNNLFSRWDFKASFADVRFRPAQFLKDGTFQRRQFEGAPIKEKDAESRVKVAERILAADPDVLAVQEVEDGATLAELGAKELRGRYPYRTLVEGNDDRLIDVGILSKLPLGEVRSYRHWRHPELPQEPIFRRDLLAAEVLSPKTGRRLMWLLVTHLKSRFIDWRLKKEAERKAASDAAMRIRRWEAESIARIVSERFPAEELVVLCGDLNDTPDAQALSPLFGKGKAALRMVNVLAKHIPDAERWTATHKPTGEPRRFEQIDYLLVPSAHAERVERAWIGRRRCGVSGKDGSDHDPVFCALKV